MTEHVDLFEDLVRIETQLWNELDLMLLQAHGVSLAWVFPLRVLARAPGSRVVDLAHDIGISPGGASKLVDRLVSAGLAARDVDAADRRTSRLTLTRQGRRITQACSRTSEEWLAARFGDALGSAGTAELSVLVGALRAHDGTEVGAR
jgi:DNA-binding MarR family transcriptional regulator